MAIKRIDEAEGKTLATGLNSISVLGTFEGECADADITNNNGLDITRPVWEAVFNSEEYKQAIQLGWYIGFLGHPDDPNCMDFRNACIVMTEGHIDDDGKVYGKFNLLDTPVGRVVKTFIDAGVVFGISVRGAGDIIDNSVEPDTFVFRGFDLVTFPAFPNAIPQFSEIAASSDVTMQKKYKSVCSAVKKNLSEINSASAIDLIQKQFAPQSKEYAALEARRSEILSSTEADADEVIAIMDRKIEAVTRLYLDQVAENQKLASHLASVTSSSARRVKVIERITSAQISSLDKENSELSGKYRTAIAANSKLKSELETLQSSNLKYKQKVDASTKSLREQRSIVSGLRQELDETVSAASESESRSSNLDAMVGRLKSRIEAAEQLLFQYQQAYGAMYANALGVNLDNTSIQISASTTVDELKSKITAATNTSSISVNPEVYNIDEVSEDEDSGEPVADDGSIIYV